MYRYPMNHLFELFLSTPSARRATKAVSSPLLTLVDFYPRPPRGERQFFAVLKWHRKLISIHALREESDAFFMPWVRALPEFLSTPSARRATPHYHPGQCLCSDFYPRPPRGERRVVISHRRRVYIFLSTPSARRATQKL